MVSGHLNFFDRVAEVADRTDIAPYADAVLTTERLEKVRADVKVACCEPAAHAILSDLILEILAKRFADASRALDRQENS